MKLTKFPSYAHLFHGEEGLSGLFADLVDGAEGARAKRLADRIVGDEAGWSLALIRHVHVAADLVDHVTLYTA